MKVFISGGCKNGKSYYAQRLAKTAAGFGGAERPLYYIATMRPVDSEDDERIARHIDDREGWGFETVEQASGIEEILQKCDIGGSFLLDSLTALLANEMFPPGGKADEQAAGRVVNGVKKILEAVGSIVVVSDYIYSDAIEFDPLTECYRKSLAAVDCVSAKLCDVVLEISYAGVIVHKGQEIFSSDIELYEHV